MPHRRIPNTATSAKLTLVTARDKYKDTPSPGARAISAEQWAKLNDADPTSFLNRWLKEEDYVDLAMSTQGSLTSVLAQTADRLSMLCSHFHQVFDFGVTRGIFPASARAFYKRDIGATSLPDLSTYDAIALAAENIVNGETKRATAEAAGVPTYDSGLRYDSGVRYADSASGTPGVHVVMSMPSAAEIGVVREEFLRLRSAAHQAEENTDVQREEFTALYPEGHALAVDVCDTVEFFFRKDPDDSSRRAHCARWGVVYIYDPNEPQPPVEPTPPGTPTP